MRPEAWVSLHLPEASEGKHKINYMKAFYLIRAMAIFSFLFFLSCRPEDNDSNNKNLKRQEGFMRSDSIEFKKEEGTDFVIIFKDSTVLKNIRDSLIKTR